MAAKTLLVERRSLKFDSLDEVLKDAELLVNAEQVVSAGTWNLAQTLMHLAIGMRMSMESGINTKRSLMLQIMGPIIKRRILKHGMKPGYKLPEKVARLLVPKENTKLTTAWDALQSQVERMKECQKFYPHPVFGDLTRDEWLKLTLRHAELHLSFLRPA